MRLKTDLLTWGVVLAGLVLTGVSLSGRRLPLPVGPLGGCNCDSSAPVSEGVREAREQASKDFECRFDDVVGEIVRSDDREHVLVHTYGCNKTAHFDCELGCSWGCDRAKR